MNNVGVKFKNSGKEYIFYDNNIDVFVGDYVIVETEKGQQFGKVSSISKVKLQDENHSKIIKIAEESDIKQNKKNIVEAKLALEKETEQKQIEKIVDEIVEEVEHNKTEEDNKK